MSKKIYTGIYINHYKFKVLFVEFNISYWLDFNLIN